MSMTLDDLEKLAEELRQNRDERERHRLALAAMQQGIVDILSHLARQGPAIADAIREGFAAAKPPQVNVSPPPVVHQMEMPAPRPLPDMEVDTRPDGTVQRIRFVAPKDARPKAH